MKELWGKDKKRLKEHALAHHTGLISLHLKEHNPESRCTDWEYNKRSDALQLQISLKESTNTANQAHTWERLCFVSHGRLQRFHSTNSKVFPLFRNLFACAVPKLSGGFKKRKVVVYRQMELIRTETVERMNELLEGVVDFVDITSDSWTANHQHFLSLLLVHGVASDFKNHSFIPSLYHLKTGLPLKWRCCCERVFESAAAATLPWKEDCCCNNRQ